MPKKLLLVDAPNHAFRAYHAIQSDMRAPDGFPTRAIYGFTRVLLALVRDHRPDYVALVFDVGRTYRNEIYPAYKGQRPDMPEDLRQQWGELRPLCEAFGYAVIAEPNTEADDVIGTLAVRFAGPDLDVGIVSGDKDFGQLVNEHIHIVDLLKNVEIDRSRVVERWGVPPERVIDLLALMGDAADNVPGVPGVGEKKAAQFIQKYGSLDEVLAHADEIGGKTGQAVKDNADTVRLARRLVTIQLDVPVAVTLADLAPRPRDAAGLFARLSRYNFKSLITDLKLDAPPAGAPNGEDGVPEGVGVHDVGPAIGEGGGCPLIWGPGPLAALAARLTTAGRVGLAVAPPPGVLLAPTVAAGGGPVSGTSAGPGGALFAGAEEGAAAPVRVRDAVQGADRVAGALYLAWDEGGRTQLAHVPWDHATERALRGVLTGSVVEKTGYDLKQVMKRLGAARPDGLGAPYPLSGVASDVLIADYLLKPDQKRGLDELCQRWLDAPLGPLPYDPVLAAWRLDARLTPELTAWAARRVYTDVDLPILPVLAAMEARGIGVDRAALLALSTELEGRLATMVEEIHAAAGGPFNVNSTQQLAMILFEKLQLKGGKKIKTGWSTDADTLDKLRDQHPLPGAILAYRELFKLKNTYIDTLPRFIAADGRIHTTYDQTVAATGRLSSNDPNLQNIPVRSEEGRRIRRCFVARPGHVYVSADYSQIELRILAHYCGEGPLVESFRNDEDIHRRTAAEIFGVMPGLVTAEQRRAAKAINFGIVYGMGPARLANDLRIPRAEAQAYIDGYFARYPQVRAYMDGACARARETGYAETLYGRRRVVAGLDAGNPMDRAGAERVAINTPIQGTAADIIKIAMARVEAALHGALASTGAALLLQVHDELVLEVPEGSVDAVRRGVAAVMESVVTLAVPLKVDTGSASTWDAAH